MRVRPGALLGNRRGCQNSLVKNPAPPRSGRPGSITEGRAAENRIKRREKKTGACGARTRGRRTSSRVATYAAGGDEKTK